MKYTYNVLILSHNQTWLRMTLCLFFVIAFSHAHNCTQKNRFRLNYMKRPKIFSQDQVFAHRVAFKHLHKGLRPFTNVGLHKRGVRLPGDDRCGACSPYIQGLQAAISLAQKKTYKTSHANRQDFVHLPTVFTLWMTKKICFNLNSLNTCTEKTSSCNVKPVLIK
jgi:hypothetical protein